ncbi:sulfotransferase domain-containing protein [Mesorhizobium sp. B2-3-12]|uniref:sulfotransferase domain-containing protein n=1 Tax=Mesorhizobium sp. B2-3-12 TaxID=2589952 RepID=UPI0011288F26|nr:sulfotransferase domain-containing protein [Mesorhizobium sp. B2-3-12]TPL86017.1 sulfotransferase domain-containing protein [Mesorhizobium sp. B2-3-12]
MTSLGETRIEPGGNAARVRIMGTPRSGTNLAKHLVETHLGMPVVFDQGFWKHGVFPALMDGRRLQYGDLPIIVMSKDPITQLLSWFRFSRNDSIFRPAKYLGPFLNQPFEIRQDFTQPGQMEYRFRSPADYWNQFYFAMDALRRTGAPVHFVCYEQLVSAPAACLASISRFLDLSPPFDAGTTVTIPRHTIGASNDIDRPADPAAKQGPFDPARADLAAALARIGWRNARLILRDIDEDVLGATGRPGFREQCREAAGAKAMLRSLVGFW